MHFLGGLPGEDGKKGIKLETMKYLICDNFLKGWVYGK